MVPPLRLILEDAPAALAAAMRAAGFEPVEGAGDAMLIVESAPGAGAARVAALRAAGQTLPVLVVGLVADGAVAALDAGADDYRDAAAPADEIVARIAALVRGRRWGEGAGDLLRAGDIAVSPSRFRAWRGARAIDLVNYELRLLVELVRAAGVVQSRAALTARIWGPEAAPTSNLIDVYVRRLRAKLTAAGERDPIATIRGAGYLLRGD